MRASLPPLLRRPLVLTAASLLLGAGVLTGCGSKRPPPPPQAGGAPAPKPTNAAPAAATNVAAQATNQFLGEFLDDPKSGGRDPFFPKRRLAYVPATPSTNATDTAGAVPRKAAISNLVLQAIVRMPDRQMAIINRVRMEVGQEAVVKFPGGEAKVKLVEVLDRSVKILLDDEPAELSQRRGGQ